ncbi:MAG TPA: ABC transporter permease [Candidatus Acidoferrum sp.]|jgi:putative ABC transport system permease protein
MNSFRTFIHRLRGVFRKSRQDSELSAELQAHLDALTEENIRRGMTAQAARHAARREFGGLEQAREAYREQRGFTLFDSLSQDFRFAFRMLAKSPGFTAAAILTLALGIGANTAIFSAVNGVLLRPMPYAHPEKLVQISALQIFPGGVEVFTSFSASSWKQIREKTPAIEQLGVYDQQGGTITGDNIPENISYAAVSGSFFSTLGVPPLLGRPILPADEDSDQKDIAVIAYGLWKERLNGDADVLRRKIFLDGKPYRIIGVMPPGFVFVSEKKGAWIPFAPQPGQEAVGMAVARIRAGATLTQLNAQLKVAGGNVGAQLKTSKNWTAQATGVKEAEVNSVREALLVLLASVGFVLLIACVNVSGLLLTRAWTRQREVAIRAALGATRIRLIRQFLAESTLLALTGGAVGLLVSAWGIRLLRAMAPANTPRLDEIRIDPIVLWFTLGISVVAGILFGLMPALQVSAEGPSAALKGTATTSAGTAVRKTHRLRNLLVISEIALAVILVIGATLVAKSFAKITNVSLGIRTDHLITLTANFEKSACPESQGGCWLPSREVLRRIRLLPGVIGADVASTLPVDSTSLVFFFRIEGQNQTIGLEQGDEISDREVSPHYFETLGIPLLSGRGFDDKDVAAAPHVAIVNETLARKYFAGSPLGHRISRNGRPGEDPNWLEIVGVAANSHDVQIEHKPISEYYAPMAQLPSGQSPSFVVRTTADPGQMASVMKDAIWSVDKNAPITSVRTMDQIVAESVAEPRFRTLLLGAFGALGLVLAMIGVYGVISYAVSQRSREIGIRMALGASPQNVLRALLREGLVLARLGVLAGVGGALALTKFLQNQLFEVMPTDPYTFISVAILLPLVALLACYVPARRAMRVDPLVALRYE